MQQTLAKIRTNLICSKTQFIGHIFVADSKGPCSFSDEWPALKATTYVRQAYRP